MWDKGSNRVLIREDYAKLNKFISKEVTYMIHVVDAEPKQVNSRIYLVDLKDMYGNVHTVWGYGVNLLCLLQFLICLVCGHYFHMSQMMLSYHYQRRK